MPGLGVGNFSAGVLEQPIRVTIATWAAKMYEKFHLVMDEPGVVPVPVSWPGLCFLASSPVGLFGFGLWAATLSEK